MKRKEIEVPIKYAFPLFTKDNSTDYLIKHEQIRVSDLWAFWKYIIGRYVKKYSGEKEFLLTLIEQARYFYETAENAPIKSQPLLYYYSFLNLVKVVINVNALSTYGTNFTYNHGVRSCGIKKKDKLQDLYVEIKSLLPQAGATPPPGKLPDLSVAYTFMKQMGDDVVICPKKLNIVDMLKACVGIHRTYSETNNEKEIYIRLGNPQLFREGKTLRCKYEIMECDSGIASQLATVGYNIVQETDTDGITSYYWIEEETMKAYKETKSDYYNLANKLRKKGIWYYTDGCCYRTFISTSSLVCISTESIIYNLMFFFGSITRYHPYMFDKLLTEQQMWLISEFLKTQPKQFLYAVTSRTIESAVLKPNTANILF